MCPSPKMPSSVIPDPPPAPAPAPLPPDPPTAASPAVQGQKASVRNRANASGSASTILTGPAGLTSTATDAPKSLLGG